MPKGRKFVPKNSESPAQEMKRLIRAAGGKRQAGEKDPALMARARRRINIDLADDRKISLRRARSYWHGEILDIPSDHMDRAREVAFVLPLEEAIEHVEAAEQFIRNLRERILDRIAPVGGADSGAADRGRPDSGALVDDQAAELDALAPPPAVLRLISNSSP
jgi:hypothetical protein